MGEAGAAADLGSWVHVVPAPIDPASNPALLRGPPPASASREEHRRAVIDAAIGPKVNATLMSATRLLASGWRAKVYSPNVCAAPPVPPTQSGNRSLAGKPALDGDPA